MQFRWEILLLPNNCNPSKSWNLKVYEYWIVNFKSSPISSIYQNEIPVNRYLPSSVKFGQYKSSIPTVAFTWILSLWSSILLSSICKVCRQLPQDAREISWWAVDSSLQPHLNIKFTFQSITLVMFIYLRNSFQLFGFCHFTILFTFKIYNFLHLQF